MSADDRSTNQGLWIGVAIGAPVVAFGIIDALGDAGRTKPAELTRWIVGAALVLDLAAIPLAFAVGRLVGHRAPLRWALAATATLIAVGWPFIRGYGRQPGNPSLLPRNYGVGVTIAVAVVWLAALLGTVVQHRLRSTRRGRS